MAGPHVKFTLTACAAAIGCAFGQAASAQSLESRGRDLLNNSAAIPFLESSQAGIDRALKRPLEVIWLQADVQDDIWRNPALASALQGCGKLGTPKEGCAVSVRSAWRYSFDSNSGVRSSAIFISSLSIPEAPFGAGRLNLSGTGRVYIVTPHAAGSAALRPPSGAILLAAGSTVQLVDAAHPMIQIEVKAPEDQPLFLGNLAESDLTKVVALLVKQPGVLSASAANILDGGQVALRAPAVTQPSIQVAAVSAAARTESLLDLSGVAGSIEPPALQAGAALEPVAVLDQDFSMLAGVMESAAEPRLPREQLVVASLDLAAMAGRFEVPLRAIAPVSQTSDPLRPHDFTLLAAGTEIASLLPVAAPVPVTIASIDLSAMAGRLELPLREIGRGAPEKLQAGDFTLLAGAVEKSSALPAPASFSIASIDLSGIAGKLELPARELGRVAEAPLQARDFTLLAAAVEQSSALPAPVQVAATPALAPIQVAMAAPAPAPAPASDLAKMRAEIEAELARERERMAQSLQGRATRQFRFGT